MAIDKESGMFWVACEDCGDAGGPFETFQDALDYAELNGWHRVWHKTKGEWENYCNLCDDF